MCASKVTPGIFLFHPTIPNYPKARFPGVVVFSEIYQGKPRGANQSDTYRLTNRSVTGPVQRFARQIAGKGYIVAAPSSYHEFTGPEALAYDGPGTDAGNSWKIEKVLANMQKSGNARTDTCFRTRNSPLTTKMPFSASPPSSHSLHATGESGLRACA